MNITMRKYVLSSQCELLSNQHFIHSDCVDVQGVIMLSSISPQCACRASDPPSPKEIRSLCIPRPDTAASSHLNNTQLHFVIVATNLRGGLRHFKAATTPVCGC
jgi:hypothetical protein